MEPLHITEAMLAADTQAVLRLVQSGAEVVVERDSQPLAVLRAPTPVRTMSEVIAAMESAGVRSSADPDFARDVEDGIRAQSGGWNLPSWA